jgi:polysaccharide export outer membrane protein
VKPRIMMTGIIGITCLFFVFQGMYSQEATMDYKIGPKDLLEIRVIGHDDASTTVRVSEDGLIYMPYLKEVQVAGFTKIQLERKLEELLAEGYFQNPQVTIFIQEYKSNIVSIIGAVNSPGEYELIGRQTLMDIISKAGGPTGEEGKEIIVFRRLPDGSSTSLKVSRDGLLDEGNPELNIPLQPGDVVNVPIDRVVHIFVTGEVRNPGMLEVKKSDLPNFTLLKAIAQAGGFAERAAKGGVKIIRKDEEGREQTIKVDAKDIEKGKKPDVQLFADDVVIVPESIF